MAEDKPPPPPWFYAALVGLGVGGLAAFTLAPMCTAVALVGVIHIPKPWDPTPQRGRDMNEEYALSGFLLLIGSTAAVTKHVVAKHKHAQRVPP